MRLSALILVALAVLALGLALGGGGTSSPGTAAPAHLTTDDQYAELARIAPGYAGMFYGDDGKTLHVLVKDDTAERRAVVERAIIDFLDPVGHLARPPMRFAPARYDFLELKQWYDKLAPEVLVMKGAVWTDIDEMKNQLAFGVEDVDTRAAVERTVRELHIPEDAVRVEISEPIVVEPAPGPG